MFSQPRLKMAVLHNLSPFLEFHAPETGPIVVHEGCVGPKKAQRRSTLLQNGSNFFWPVKPVKTNGRVPPERGEEDVKGRYSNPCKTAQNVCQTRPMTWFVTFGVRGTARGHSRRVHHCDSLCSRVAERPLQKVVLANLWTCLPRSPKAKA